MKTPHLTIATTEIMRLILSLIVFLFLISPAIAQTTIKIGEQTVLTLADQSNASMVLAQQVVTQVLTTNLEFYHPGPLVH
jgi:hypothetical protein